MFDHNSNALMRAIATRAQRRWHIGLAPFLIGGFATAQLPAAEPQVSEGESLESIVVTARRREESLQDTPVAVTALSAAALERQQAIGTTDLDKIAPNLQFHCYGTLTGNNSAAQVFIRGIGQTDATPAVDPGVGIYIDDVYMGRAVGGAMDFRDIASVQILRGPQGTLFGRNSIGGAVLLTTNAPGDGAGNSVRVGVGEDNLHELFGAFDVPLGDDWSARLALGGRQRDGYVKRVFDGKDLGDEKMYTGQVGIRWKPSDAFTLTLRGDYTKEDENGSPFVFRAMNEAATFVGAASQAAGCPDMIDPLPPPVLVGPLADPRCGNDAQALGPFTNGGTYPASSTLKNAGASLVAQWRISDMLSLKSITADRSLRWTGTRDADNTPLLILHTNYNSKSDQFSEELQAVISASRVDGVVGLYYFDEDSFDRLLVPLGNPGTSYDTQRVSMDATAKAAFTEWTFKFTDAFAVSAGVRYTKESKGLQATMFNVSPASAAGTSGPHRPVSVCRPAAHADRVSVPDYQSLRARFQRHHQVRQRAIPFQPAHHGLRELGGRLQERRIQSALQRGAAGQCADLIRSRDRQVLRGGIEDQSHRYAAAEPGTVQDGLRRHPDDLSTGRRAAAVQRGRRLHRRRRT